MPRILLLGGTNEASRLAGALAERGADAVFSYAGRTTKPIPQPLPTRIGGFGGVEGLKRFIADEGITHIVDATHPFAAGMCWNAAAAAEATGVESLSLQRPPWAPQAGDDWTEVGDVDAAVRALPAARTRIFLAIGRQNIGAFATAPQHHYVLRIVDEPDGPLPLPDCAAIVSRGPFTRDGDAAMMRERGIELVVSKNAGGNIARAKIDAARELGLPVIMIARPEQPERTTVATVEDALGWLQATGALPDSGEAQGGFPHGTRLGV